MLSVLLMLGLVSGCDDITNPFADFSKRAEKAEEAGDMVVAAQWWTKGAEQGNAEAQYNLAFMYDYGEGVAEDDKQAVYWYTKAAEQGFARAQYNLAFMYDNGEGVAEDDKQAVYWYTKAAEQGNAKAQYNLALMYANGEGAVEDDVKAHMWFNIAAADGHNNAKSSKKKIEQRMSPSQIEKAQEMARECVAKNYKGC